MELHEIYFHETGQMAYTPKPNAHETEEFVEWMEGQIESLKQQLDKALFWIHCTEKGTEGSLEADGVKVTQTREEIIEVLEGE